VARYKKLNLPTYYAGVNPMLTSSGASGAAKVEMSYPQDPVKQYLYYGAMYDDGLKQTEPIKAAIKNKKIFVPKK
jgi:hypothetical protein